MLKIVESIALSSFGTRSIASSCNMSRTAKIGCMCQVTQNTLLLNYKLSLGNIQVNDGELWPTGWITRRYVSMCFLEGTGAPRKMKRCIRYHGLCPNSTETMVGQGTSRFVMRRRCLALIYRLVPLLACTIQHAGLSYICSCTEYCICRRGSQGPYTNRFWDLCAMAV